MAHRPTELKNYKKAKTVEVDDVDNDFKFLPEDVTRVKVKSGSKLQNLLQFAIKVFKEEEKRHILFTGIGHAVTKTISCAEIMKRKFKELHQITKIKYKRIEDIWEPKIETLDTLKVMRDVPAISILLCKDPLDSTEPGYQPPGRSDAFWKKCNRENQDRTRQRRRAPKRDLPGSFRQKRPVTDSTPKDVFTNLNFKFEPFIPINLQNGVMASDWLETLRKSEKTCLIQDGKRKVHYSFPDGKEMAEEYDMRTNALLGRKWRHKTSLGSHGRWEVEVGDPNLADEWKMEADGFRESISNPSFMRKDTPVAFQWRIRNLPYPYSVYQVKVDEASRSIIVSTSNRKYYKKFNIPDLDRAQLPLEPRRLSYSHGNNTLVVSYEKPSAILDMEKSVQEQLKNTKANRDGKVECNPS